jgi:D-aminopeptidase
MPSRALSLLVLLLGGPFLSGLEAQETPRPRLRDLGIATGILAPGPLNTLTDVAGVRVGHTTLVEGDDVFQQKVPAAVFAANAFGKAAGFLQVKELGTIETPIVLTNTLCVGTAVQATVDWTLAQPGNEAVRSVNAVVGETNDGYLNDIRHCAVTAEHVAAAIEGAETGPVEEGSVGAGTGTSAFGWKGGIGTSSRVLPETLGGYTVGALVQSNFGGVLTIDGLRVGERVGRIAFQDAWRGGQDALTPPGPEDDGSCMIVVATDAPVDPRQLERMARRAVLGLARAGSFMHHGSGDFVIAFSTRNPEPHRKPGRTATVELLYGDFVSPLFLATVEAVEEAVLNSILKATTVEGHGAHPVEALPLEPLRRMIQERRRQ